MPNDHDMGWRQARRLGSWHTWNEMCVGAMTSAVNALSVGAAPCSTYQVIGQNASKRVRPSQHTDE